MDYLEHLALEDKSASSHSPSKIVDEEAISRVLFAPKHFNNGKLTPNSFEQLFDPKGMSVLRNQYDFQECLIKTIKIIEGFDPLKKYIGYASCSVKELRDVKHETCRLFYILDTATEDRIGHADIFTTRKVVDFPPPLINKLIRSKIFRLFDKNIFLTS